MLHDVRQRLCHRSSGATSVALTGGAVAAGATCTVSVT